MTDFSKYIVYVDESGDAKWAAAKEFPVLCVNYCLFEKGYYIDTLIPQFNRLKFKYWGTDNIVLHERDLRKSDKINDPATRAKYKRVSGEKRTEFMAELSALMANAEFKCFCVVIDKPKIPEAYQAFDPYHISLSRGFRQIEDYLKTHDPEELDKDLHIVFEKRGHDDDAALSRAYQQIKLSGSLIDKSQVYRFAKFRLELMDKRCNSTGLQIADLTARPIGNHYLHTTDQKKKTDQRAADIVLKKLHYCANGVCEQGKYDVVHKGL